MNDRAKIKELINRIDEVLYYLWDPIGVSDNACARGEYTTYVGAIMQHVMDENVEKIVEKLSNIESESMGLEIGYEKNKMIAERLIEDKQAIEEGIR